MIPKVVNFTKEEMDNLQEYQSHLPLKIPLNQIIRMALIGFLEENK